MKDDIARDYNVIKSSFNERNKQIKTDDGFWELIRKISEAFEIRNIDCLSDSVEMRIMQE